MIRTARLWIHPFVGAAIATYLTTGKAWQPPLASG